jgi:hypothetical protein
MQASFRVIGDLSFDRIIRDEEHLDHCLRAWIED